MRRMLSMSAIIIVLFAVGRMISARIRPLEDPASSSRNKGAAARPEDVEGPLCGLAGARDLDELLVRVKPRPELRHLCIPPPVYGSTLESMLREARTNRDTNQAEAAESALRRILRIDPFCEVAHAELGDLLHRHESSGRTAEARIWTNRWRALTSFRDYWNACVRRRICGCMAIQASQAIWHRTLNEDPGWAAGHVCKGLDAMRDAADDSIGEDFERGLKLDPGAWYALNAFGMYHARRREGTLAVEFFGRAITAAANSDPRPLALPLLHLSRANALLETGRTAEALLDVERARALDRDVELEDDLAGITGVHPSESGR